MKKSLQEHTNKGYSLVELLIYVSIFSVIAIVVVNSLIVSTRSFAETRTNRVLLHAGFDIMERVSREARDAESIVLLESTLGSHPGVVTFMGTTDADEPREVRIAIEDGTAVLYENDVLMGPLSGADVVVTNLVFRSITIAGAEAVRAELTVEDVRGHSAKTADFFDTIILRGSYQ